MRQFRMLLPVTPLLLGLGACTGGTLSIAQRIAATHNVLGPTGFASLGPISEGYLGQGEADEVELQLQGRECYSINAFGADGIWDIDLDVLDAQGVPLAGDAARSPQASVHFCPERSGRYALRVTAMSGAGHWAAGVWSSAPGGVSFGGAGAGGGGTCDAPTELAPNGTARGSTAGGDDLMAPACVRPGDSFAPDAVYQVTVEQRGVLRAQLTTQYDGVLSLLSECSGGDVGTLACNDDVRDGDTTHAAVEARVEPGSYFLVVDGYASEAGAYTLETSFEVLRDPAEVCADLQELVPGEEVSGTTVGQGDDFRTDQECTAGSRAPDVGYQLELTEPSRVRVTLTSEYDGALAIRSDCQRESSVIACNDDFGEGEEGLRRSQVVAQLEPGTYTVIVDGYEGEEGDYRLTATVAPVGRATAPNDTCAGATNLRPDQDGTADTFFAADDYRGSCIAQPGAPDVVFRVEVPSRSLLGATASGGDLSDPVLYLQGTCGDSSSELACGTRTLTCVVPAGTYFLVADGGRADAVGSTTVRYELSDVAPLEAACSDAPILAAGETVRGRTSGTGRFGAACGEGAGGPEAVYQLRVRERSRVELSVEAEFDSVLHVRRDCVDPGTAVDCNDDAGDSNHSALDLQLDPGTYYVFVDGYGEGGESGPFTLRAEVTPR
ncbi:MAG: hypothetical protein JXB32_22225 [Deltaproteobacteria bacterium]|nr:hypothetical protein [Deltaproteobacteria bacterium]